MVATRRGVRVYSPNKTNPEQSSDVQATPSGRVTRRAAKQVESNTQHALAEACNQIEKSEDKHCTSSPPSSMKRCTRSSRLHSPMHPSTPLGSTHEEGISDVESLCSVTSDVEIPITRMTRRKRLPPPVSQENEISDVESCSSAVSASNAGLNTSRNTRRNAIAESSDPALVKLSMAKAEMVQETESCSSVVSETQRVTRSQRKTARTRSIARQQVEDSEVSDSDSCLSGFSGAGVSATRRTTRSRRQTGSIPLRLDEAAESSLSPALPRRSSRTVRGKTAVTADLSEPQSCDSEGFESGPVYSARKQRRGKASALDSDSELTDVHSPVGSPCSTRSKETPCSSRTGSGSSSHRTRASQRSVKQLCLVLEKVLPDGEDTSLNDSRLENTVIAEDADCTLLEEEESQTMEEKDAVSVGGDNSIEVDTIKKERGVKVTEEHNVVSHSSVCAEEAVGKPAVVVKDQQGEPCVENKEGDSSVMEDMQETASASERESACEKTSETIEETEDGDRDTEVVVVDTCPSQEGEDEDSVVEIQPGEEEKMDVASLNSDSQQVVDSSEVVSIHLASSQQCKITVADDPKQQPEDTVIVQNRKTVSLLESSEDEEEDDDDDEEDERDISDEDHVEEERGRPSHDSEAAGTSLDGLFMIDTRPGQEADEQYYMEKPMKKEEKTTQEERVELEEEEEEFVDEEGEDEEEDASILFSSRNPLLKEMSSRIDPGIRMKELGGLYINFDGSKSKPVSSSLQKLKEKKIQDEVMKKSVIGPDFEKKDAAPPYSESKEALKLKRRVEREKSTGDAWFNMKAPELSQELKGDLQVLKMRGSLDPKRFYKKNDRDGFPKYFQIGTVVDNPVDFYHSRIPKKDRKRTMVEELLADAEFRHKNKRKYQQIVAEKAAQGAGRRNKKKNKFHKK